MEGFFHRMVGIVASHYQSPMSTAGKVGCLTTHSGTLYSSKDSCSMSWVTVSIVACTGSKRTCVCMLTHYASASSHSAHMHLLTILHSSPGTERDYSSDNTVGATCVHFPLIMAIQPLCVGSHLPHCLPHCGNSSIAQSLITLMLWLRPPKVISLRNSLA